MRYGQLFKPACFWLQSALLWWNYVKSPSCTLLHTTYLEVPRAYTSITQQRRANWRRVRLELPLMFLENTLYQCGEKYEAPNSFAMYVVYCISLQYSAPVILWRRTDTYGSICIWSDGCAAQVAQQHWDKGGMLG